MALTDAVEALGAGEPERALTALLDAWRACRHSRIADVIAFVSDDITAQRPVIAAKTVAKRNELWREIERRRDPADLGRLLALPLPRAWKPALAMMQPLLAWPDDPRLARHLAVVVEQRPYDTAHSSDFYEPLVAAIGTLQDLRVLPMLRRAQEKRGSAYWEHNVWPRIATTIAALERQEPALSAETLAVLAQLEARYASRIVDANELAASNVDHLTAIYAAPDDLALRAVYADFLQEQSDPRGEFITLQLARLNALPSDAAFAREHALLEEHGERWMGGLNRWFQKDRRLFHAGFFAGGGVSVSIASNMETALADPACSLLRTLEGRGPFFELLFAAPELRSLVEVEVDFARAVELAARSPRSLTALRFETPYAATSLVETALAHCEGLPALREIAITTRHLEPLAAWVAEAPVVERLERLVVRHEIFPTVIAALERRGGALRELEVEQLHVRHGDTGWQCLLQRDAAPGPFTRFVARPRGVPHGLEGLSLVLERLPTTLRELSIATPKKLSLPKAEMERLVEAMARFPSLERRELPWPLAAAPRQTAVERPALAIRLVGDPMFVADKLPAIWKLVEEDHQLGMDSFDVGAKWRELGKAPLERVLKWAANARCHKIHVFRDGTPYGMWLQKKAGYYDRCSTTLSIPSGNAAEMIAWLLRFMELGTFVGGNAWLAHGDVDLEAFDFEDFRLGARGGWLVFFAPDQLDLLPVERVRAAGFATYSVGAGLLLAITPTPEELTTERLAAAARSLTRIMRARLVERLGFDLHERAAAIVEPAARSLGLVPYDDPARPRSLTVRYVKPSEPFARIEIELPARIERPTICTSAIWYYMHGEREARNTGTQGTTAEVPNRAALDAALTEVAREVLPALAARI